MSRILSLSRGRIRVDSVTKRVLVHNHSNENEFDLHLNNLVSETRYLMKGCAPALVLKHNLQGNWEMAYLDSFVFHNMEHVI